jgi:CDP-4-dehydro-6-deoxyglucose reductase, E3
VLCLAAGTGLAPILALAEAALRRGYKRPVGMVFSARTKEDVYSQGMMAWWRTKHRNFDYKITLTREVVEGYQSGRIDAVLPALYPDLSKYSIFAAGSPEFVETCVATVKKLGAQPELIHTEGFFSQQVQQSGEDDPFKLPF